MTTKTLEVFQYHGNDFQVLGDYSNPKFIAKEICTALNIANHRDALTRLDDDEKGVEISDTPGGRQEILVVNEPGLYSLVLRSTKPEAKAFKRWLMHEVLPAIRKHGSYQAKQPQHLLNRNSETVPLCEVLELKDQIISLQKQLLEYRPELLPKKEKLYQDPASDSIKREAYRLREVEKLSWTEISEAVGYSKSSVRNYWLELKKSSEVTTHVNS